MNKLLWTMLAILVVLPITVNAEVYKWVDKDGTTRYSDSPPPSNMKKLPVNGKKPPGTPPVSAMTVEEAAQAAAAAPAATAKGLAPAASGSDAKKKATAKSDEDAAKRQKESEEDKKKSEQKEAELKQKQQNCTNARANLNSYKVGGRMSNKTNAKGEREYLSDADIATGLAQAQKDVDQYCSE